MPKLACCLLATLAAALAPATALASNGGTAPDGGTAYGNNGGASPLTPPKPKPKPKKKKKSVTPAPPAMSTPGAAPVVPGDVALTGTIARASASTPAAVQAAVRAGNRLRHKPYRYGGGHKSFRDTGYDCSGAVSYVLHGAGLLNYTLDSTEFEKWGDAGPGSWITVYANADHAFVVVGGLRLDTSGTGESGPRWRPLPRSTDGFVARHPAGY